MLEGFRYKLGWPGSSTAVLDAKEGNGGTLSTCGALGHAGDSGTRPPSTHWPLWAEPRCQKAPCSWMPRHKLHTRMARSPPITSQKEEKGVGKKDHPEGQKEPWGVKRL